MVESTPIIQMCEVVDVNDDKGGDRIKVVMAADNYKGGKKNIDELPWAFPLLPKMLHVKPKVGESVIVLLMNPGESSSQRFYIGPVITQPTHMYEEPHNNDSEAFFKGSYVTPDPNPYNKPKMMGAFPENEDITIEGRRNCGIQITDNDIRIKAGVKKSNINGDEQAIEFNREDPAFIKLSYNTNKDVVNENDHRSSAVIVADKIMLLGNNPESNLINSYKTDNDTVYKNVNGEGKVVSKYTDAARNLITEKEMENLLDEMQEMSYKIPYGEPLIKFLSIFRDAFKNHTHPFPTMQPCNTDELKYLMNYNLDDLLSNTVRIN